MDGSRAGILIHSSDTFLVLLCRRGYRNQMYAPGLFPDFTFRGIMGIINRYIRKRSRKS